MFKLGFKVLLPSCHYLRRHKINLQQINSQAVSELFNLSAELLADFFFSVNPCAHNKSASDSIGFHF